MANPDVTIPGPEAAELMTGIRLAEEIANNLQLLASGAELLARLCRDHEEPDGDIVETLWAMSKNVLTAAVHTSALANEALCYAEKLLEPREGSVA